jgi:2-dehydro-3-deoxygluconokinase
MNNEHTQQHQTAMLKSQYPTPEFITFGETMALMIPNQHKGLEFASSLQSSFGGAESNVAIGVARLGHSSGWFGRLGNDPLGRMILKKIRGEGVDVSRAQLTSDAPTGVMFREVFKNKTSVFYYRKYSAASKMQPEHLDHTYIEQAKMIHLTGITPALSESCRQTLLDAIHIARQAGVKVSFDPNIRLKLWPLEEAREVLLSIAAQADYFLPGLDELKLLYQVDDWDEIVSRLRELSAISIVKGGDRATYVVTKDEIITVPYYPVEHIVDTVGAGDGFCAGFIVGLLKGYSYTEAVKIGNLIGSLVIQVEGDWEGIPTWEEVEAIMMDSKHIER